VQLYFDTSKVDKQLGIILVGYNNRTTEHQDKIDIKIAVFLDKYNLYKNITEYRTRYREPTTVLDYVLLYSSLEAILALILLFIQLDLQGVFNLVEFKKDIETLVEYQEVKPLQVSKFIENLGEDSEGQDNDGVPAELTALQERTVRKEANKQ
jgi:hypothetical protein